MSVTNGPAFYSQLVAIRPNKPENHAVKLSLDENRIAIASDVHIPFYDEELLGQFFRDCEKWRVEAIVWLGDLMDMPTFSSWGSDYSVDPFLRQAQMTHDLINLATDVVPHQYWSMGNHEARIMKKLDNQIYLEQLARMIGVGGMVERGALHLSDNPTLTAFDDSWWLTHPAGVSSFPGDVPGRIAQRNQVNVASGHAHIWGSVAVGGLTAVETGGLFDSSMFSYHQHKMGKGKEWTPGYWFLIDGEAVGFRKR